MYCSTCVFVVAICFDTLGPVFSDDKVPEVKKKAPDGVYAVLRESANEKDLLPVKEGETLVMHRHRYLKKDEKESPRFAIVRAVPDVELDLAGKPKAEKEEMEIVRILLKLKPKAATALERLTRDQVGKQVAIVVGGEVVTMHKVRDVIKGGDVQITSCVPGAANYLLEQLQAHWKSK
jgi:preprotein translocase subunit SecD